jgi:serine/threonine protein kinase/WD40 repeat protein
MVGDSPRCPRCGAPLPAPREVCPACLLRGALGDADSGDTRLTPPVEAAGETRLTPPGILVGNSARAEHPTQIGPYRIVRVLGEGGMGVVYLAEQTEPIRRQVALKVIKLGMDTRDVVARFDAERQALALMDHPHIASVFDAGATADGRPYFAMEHVAGLPITDYCDAARLSTRARLALFTKVCDAIQHAHHKGVIHRDIKPSNILVVELDGQPVPKVIDFGIAKATDQRLTERTMFTQHGLLIGTPDYMSPEQADPAGVDLDTRTDIYALGVVLYELLVGGLPFSPTRLREAGYGELLRIIREEEPVRPSARLTTLGATALEIAARRQTKLPTLAHELRGDLDWITLKALEKNRSRRYGSASELAADVERYLRSEPIVARPPTMSYRVAKFVRRNRLTVTAASVVATAIVGGLVFSTAMYLQANRDRRTAELAREEASQRAATEAQARSQADLARRDADANRSLAEREGAAANSARNLAVRRAYVSNIALAELSLDALSLWNASRQMTQTEPAVRGWEWRHLLFRTNPQMLELGSSGGFSRFVYPSTFAFSGDGSRMAWNTQTSVDVWDARTFQHVASYRNLGEVLTISPDTKYAAITSGAGSDAALLIRELESGRTVARVQGTHLVFSPNSELAAVKTADDSWNLTDVENNRTLMRVAGKWVRFLPDSKTLAVATASGTFLLDLSSGTRRPVTDTDGWPIAFSPDGTRALTLSVDTLKIIGTTTVQTAIVLRGHQVLQHSVFGTFSPDGARVATVAPDRTLRMWNASNGELLYTTVATDEHLGLNSVAFDRTGRWVLVGNEGIERAHVAVYEAGSAGGFVRLEGRAPLAFSPQGLLISGSKTSGLLVWDVARRETRQRLGEPGHDLTAVSVDASGTRIAAGYADHDIRIWDLTTGKVVGTMSGHTSSVTSIAFSPLGDLLASVADRTVKVWTLPDGRLRAQRELPETVHSVAFARDGNSVFIGLGNLRGLNAASSLERWDWRGNRVLSAADARERGIVQSVAVGPGGTQVAVAGRDWTMGGAVWDSQLQRRISTLLTDVPISRVMFAGADRIVTADTTGGMVRLWTADTFESLLTLRLPERSTIEIAASADGNEVAAASNSAVYVWQTRSPAEHNARELVRELFDKFKVVEDVVAQIGSRSLPQDVRQSALHHARARVDRPYYLDDSAWDAVKTRGASNSAYALAKRWAQVATQLEPQDPNYRTTLALAHYRTGHAQQAAEILGQARQLRSRPRTRDDIVDVLILIGLGRASDARKTLDRLAGAKVTNLDDRKLIAEGEALLRR